MDDLSAVLDLSNKYKAKDEVPLFGDDAMSGAHTTMKAKKLRGFVGAFLGRLCMAFKTYDMGISAWTALIRAGQGDCKCVRVCVSLDGGWLVSGVTDLHVCLTHSLCVQDALHLSRA